MKIIQDIKDFFNFKTWEKADLEFQKGISEREKCLGQFEYFDYGFRVTENLKLTEINWMDIQEITAYKVDLYTVDEIRIAIASDKSNITISEETPGYFVFKETIKNIFPDSDKDWEHRVIMPAFAENLTIIYKRKNNGSNN